MTTAYLDKVCQFGASVRYEDLPAEAIARSKQVIADTLAVIAAGAQEPEVRALTARLTGEHPRHAAGCATLLGNGRKTDVLTASLINGTAGTFLELDEGNQFGRGHPAVHVLPAILAVAEAEALGGRALITALVLGYEIGTRIGIAARIRMSMHPHGTWGTVGAAAAVGKLYGCDATRLRALINVSSCLSLATSRKTMLQGATVRNVYSGVSNQMGVLAHQLVASGFSGEADGLGTVYGQVLSESFDPEAMIAELGSRYEIARNYFKRHACCRYNHATLDALLQILARLPARPLDPQQVAEVRVDTYSLAAQLRDQGPRNMLAAKFSIPFAVATTIVNGHSGTASFVPQAVHDPLIQALAKKVQVVEDPALTAMMPARRPSRVRLSLTDGSVFEAEAFVNKGDAEDPYSPEELRRKYDELAAPVWGAPLAGRIHQAVQGLEALNDVRQLTGLIAPAA